MSALRGVRVLVTRAKEQADGFVAKLRAQGGEAVLAPTIRFLPPTESAPLAAALARLASAGAYDWTIFTSANAVRFFLAAMDEAGLDRAALGGTRIAAVGPGTANALQKDALAVTLVAQAHVGEGLAAELAEVVQRSPRRLRFLLPRAEVARDVVPDALRAAGADVDVVPVYRTEAPPPAELARIGAVLRAGDVDAVTFTSSSTVTHLVDALGAEAPALLARTTVFSIGPITTREAEGRGVRVDVEARSSTIDGLLDAMAEHFVKRSSKA